jgi:F-type H+-transporting ATPase subunit delta
VKQTILARRYAKAIFSVGQEQQKLEEYNEVLQGVADTLYRTLPRLLML